jgi:signal transduction histidine kinase
VSLRSKLLGLFAALAVLPLVGLGVFDYFRSAAAVRQLITDQTTVIAERSARQLSARFQILSGDLELLADNAETARLYRALGTGDSSALATARSSVDAYLAAAWRIIGADYMWISLQDAAGTRIAGVGGLPGDGTEYGGNTNPIHIVRVPVRIDSESPRVGWLVAAVRVDGLLPRPLLEARFGRGGYTLIADASGRVLVDPSARRPRDLATIAAATSADTASPLAVTLLRDGDTTRIASIARVAGADLAVISAGAVDEFSGSLGGLRATNLLLAMLFAAVLSIAFVVLTRRATRPLEVLTAAATEVGKGNFAPRLPSPGDDEVGRLTTSFAAMSGRIDEMIAELESSRQMAAVGSFARQVAHEIRNPLTSIKLNLQSLERDVAAGVHSPDNQRTVQICVEEIDRLDRVVRGVLRLGQPSARARALVAIDAVVSRALDVVRPQLDQQCVAVARACNGGELAVMADSEQLTGLFLNLLVNAAEAMPGGGRLEVSSERGRAANGDDVARVTVADTGPGVADEDRERIFEPFFTTKRHGSGLGLAVAARDAEQHRGRLMLAETRQRGRGATFVVELPLAAAEAV